MRRHETGLKCLVVTRGDTETPQLSSKRQLKLSQRCLLSEEDLFLRLEGQGSNTEGVGASATMKYSHLHTLSLTSDKHLAKLTCSPAHDRNFRS